MRGLQAKVSGFKFVTLPDDKVEKVMAANVKEYLLVNDKFWNYRIDQAAFVSAIQECVDHVKAHSMWPHGGGGVGSTMRKEL